MTHTEKIPRTPVIPLEGIVNGKPRVAMAGLHFDQAPWPASKGIITLERVALDYVNEHVLVRGGDLRRTVIGLASWFRALDPQMDASTINRSHGRLVVQWDIAHGRSPSTARRNMAMGIAALNHSKREERIKSVPKFQMPECGKPRLRWLTREEVAQLMEAPKPQRIQDFFVVAFETGVRSQAICEATWDRVDFVARTIDFRVPGKVYRNKRRPIAPINDALLVKLQEMHARRRDAYVIGAGSRGTPTCTYQACKDALVSIGINELGIARHVARHTFCSWRVQAGFSYAHIGALVGDTAQMVESTYGHLSPHHLLAASNMDTSILRVAA